jgi:sugar lactone lactonase YvrE
MKHLVKFIVALLVSTGLQAQTERIVFKSPLLYPEGVAWHPGKNLFFVSSVKTGTIGSVDKSGLYKEFYKDNMLKSSFGIKVDTKLNRLLVCISDPNYSRYSTPATFKKMARLISIDLNTGKKEMDVDLSKLQPGKHFANDLTLDDKGNIYVTDSFSPVIYRINLAGKAGIFAQSDMFKSEDVGLNGIIYHPKGFLLATHNTNGALLKVELKNPKKITTVKINTLFPGADGLIWASPDNLVLIQNKGVNKAFQIVSNDNWITAEVKGATASEDRFQYPTTATMQDDQIWVVNSKLSRPEIGCLKKQPKWTSNNRQSSSI